MAITTSNPNSRPIVTSETSTNTGVSIEIDYTEYYNRIATAVETIATNSTTIKNDIESIKNSIAVIETKQTTLAEKTSDIRDYQLAIKNFAEHDGIHIKSPWEYLYMYSILNAYVEKGYNINTAKTEVESKPKHRD